MEQYDYTELGNAKRFCELWGKQFKWVPEQKCWYIWNGKKWEEDKDQKVVREYEGVLEWIQMEMAVQLKELADCKNEDRKKEIVADLKPIQNWFKSSQSARVIKSTLLLSGAQEGMTVSFSKFDSKGQFLGVANGVVDLRDGRLVEKDPAYLVTKTSNVKYVQDAECPKWKNMLSDVMLGNQEYVDFLQVLFGSAAVGREPGWFTMFYGEKGANGKSTVVDTIGDILGDYAMVGDPSVLTDKRSGTAEYHIATYKGARFVVYNEAKKEDVNLAENLIKMVVDSGEIVGRNPAGRPFKFQPAFTPVFCVNHLPSVSMDPALWRRLLVLPFDYQIPMKMRNKDFRRDMMRDEKEGILAWIVEGAKMFMKDGLVPPESLLMATKKVSDEMDIIGQFLEERCLTSDSTIPFQDGGKRVLLEDIRKAFNEWAKDGGYARQYSSQPFAREMRDREYEVRKSTNNVNYVFGISLYPSNVAMMSEKKKKMFDVIEGGRD